MTKKVVKKKSKLKKPTILEKRKVKLWWAYTKIMPKICVRLDYTPQELWKKFKDFVERSDKNGEEITISWFSCYAQIARNYMRDNKNMSQELSTVIDNIMAVYESRYEQKLWRWENVSYLMNNRFKWDRESRTNVDSSHTIKSDVKWVLDEITWVDGWKKDK